MKSIIIENIDINLIIDQRNDLLMDIESARKNGEADFLKQGLVNLLEHIIDADIEDRVIENN